MSRKHVEPDLEKVLEMIRLAELNGTHSATFLTMCDGCRRWVDGIWGGGDKKRLCRDCCGEPKEKS